MHLEQISSQMRKYIFTPGTTLNAFLGAGKLHLAPSLSSLQRDPSLSGFPLEPFLYEPETLPHAVPPIHVHKKCLETGPFYNVFILGAPKAVSRSACPLETQRTLPVPGNSDRDLIFRLYKYCVFKGQVFSAPKRPQNDLRTTSGFQSE